MKSLSAIFLSIFLMLLVVAPVSAADTSKKPITPPELKHVILIHYAQPDSSPAKPGKTPAPDPIYTNYELLGLKWKNTPVSYIIDPDAAPTGANTEVYKAFEAWDEANSVELFNDTYVVDASANPSLSLPDFNNVVSWRLLAGYPKAIAITSYWYLGDEMLDADIIFNLKFKWGIDPDGEGPLQLPKGYFDVRNIATHEVGHVVGLADLYAEVDSEMTMYGYSSATETKKITLEDGDKAGCDAIY